jgi:hypothetical protein
MTDILAAAEWHTPAAPRFWRRALAAIVVVVLVVPIRRYTLPGGLPFELEPYRALVALALLAWVAALLVDPRVRVRRSGLEGPLLVFGGAALASLLVNLGRLEPVEGEVVKRVMFLATFVVVLYLVASVATRRADVDALCRLLVVGGCALAIFAAVESQTGTNLFNRLGDVIPGLELDHSPGAIPRGGRLRAYASAQHPIALAALLVMLLPLGVYLARTSRRPARWWAACTLLVVGSLATVSRTGVLMLGVVVAVFLWLRPGGSARLAVALLPVLLAVQLALPGTLETLRSSFLPPEGLIAEQQQTPGSLGSGRIADVAPSLQELAPRPVFGEGIGTRVIEGPNANALLLDDQWLGILLETGIVGLLGLLWLFLRFVRRAAQTATTDRSDRGWLAAALAASASAYGVGMLTYDAFSFVQVTFLFFVLLGLGAAVLPSKAPLGAQLPEPAWRGA